MDEDEMMEMREENDQFLNSTMNNDEPSSQMLNKGYYTPLDAKIAYEKIRNRVISELSIRYVQNKIRNKLLKVESREVELNFHKNKDEEYEDMSLLLTSEEDINSDINGDIDENLTNSDANDHLINSDINDDLIDRQPLSNQLIDIEAELSGEISEENENEDESDLRDFVDRSEIKPGNNKAAELYTSENKKMDDRMLRDLKRRYLKRKRGSTAQIFREFCSESSSDERTEEIEIGEANETADFHSVERRETMEVVPLKEMKEESERFKINEEAIKRLKKRKGETFGFQQDLL